MALACVSCGSYFTWSVLSLFLGKIGALLVVLGVVLCRLVSSRKLVSSLAILDSCFLL